MINRYRRAARSAKELGLGTLAPLDHAIPELRRLPLDCHLGQNGGQENAPQVDVITTEAEVAELADAADSKSASRKGVGVQVPPSAPAPSPAAPRPGAARIVRLTPVEGPLKLSPRRSVSWGERTPCPPTAGLEVASPAPARSLFPPHCMIAGVCVACWPPARQPVLSRSRRAAARRAAGLDDPAPDAPARAGPPRPSRARGTCPTRSR
jgi:hypothetical protein